MSLPLCLEFPEVSISLSIPMMGFDVEGLDVDLMGQLQPLLAPLMPIFDIMDALLAVFNCVKAIPDAIASVPPDPTVLVASIPELSVKVSKLVAMIPQLTIPRMVKAICNLLVSVLGKIKLKFVALQQQMLKISAAASIGASIGDAGLISITACSLAACAQQSKNIGGEMAALGKLFTLINLMMSMVGLPEVPSLDSLSGVSIELIIDPLDALISVFETVRDAIPLP